MYTNNNFGGNYYNGNYAYNYGAAAQPKLKYQSTLTPEERALCNKKVIPNFGLTEKERVMAICNHRSEDGFTDTLIQDADGNVHCSICGKSFYPDENMSDEYVENVTYQMNSILQTIKMLYVNFPIEAQREYFQIIGLLEKVPALFKQAKSDFGRYDTSNNNWTYRRDGSTPANAFEMIRNTCGGNMAFSGQYNPSYPGTPYSSPMGGVYAPNPALAPQQNFGMGMGGINIPYAQPYPQGQAAMPNVNPFGYNGYTPYGNAQAQNYPYAPQGAPMPNPAPAANAAPAVPTKPVSNPIANAPRPMTSEASKATNFKA